MRDTPENRVAVTAFIYRVLADGVVETSRGNDWGTDRDLRLSIHNAHTGAKWRFLTDHDDTITMDEHGVGAPGNRIELLPNYTGSLNDALALFRSGCTENLRPVMRQYADDQWCVTFDFGEPMLNAPRVYGDDLTTTLLVCGLLSAAYLADGGKEAL
ncbi:MAG: hypothetical protein EOP83_10785 [Verrucomicrobiaceae bacterium]|nr:MAG: hypothetical protein EOP83_10785 [Verrucomicrobiaceae bacterium]